MLRNQVNFKALTFLSEQTASTFSFEVKGVRALWDPSLSIPGTNRRGGWRCPVGTRYGGQITDRFGRSCGWGVARRIANQIADIGERLENVDNRKRNDRLAKRNARMQRFLARDKKPGVLERGVRNIAEALEGEQTPRQVKPSARVAPSVQLGGMLDENGRVVPRSATNVEAVIPKVPNRSPRRPQQAKPARRRGNLRESEARRMERELVEPGAPRTGEAPKPNVPRRRRRTAAQQGAKRTARRKPEADFTDGPKPSPTKVPRRKPPSATPKPAKPSTPIPDPPTWNPTADAEAARVDSESDLYVDRLRTMNYAELERQRFNAQNDVDLRNRDVDRERLAKINAEVNRRGEKVPAQPVRPKGKDKPPARPAKPVTPPPAKKPPANDFFDIDKEFPSAKDRNVVQAAKDAIERFRPNAYNNIRGLNDRELQQRQLDLTPVLNIEEIIFQNLLREWKDKKNDPLLAEDAKNRLITSYKDVEQLKANRDALSDRRFEIAQNIPFKTRMVGADVNQPRVVPPVIQPLAPSPITPNTPPQSAVPTVETAVPDDKIVPDADAGEGKGAVRNYGQIDELEKAVKLLHEDLGQLSDVPDGIVIDAVLDGQFKDSRGNEFTDNEIKNFIRNGFPITRNVPDFSGEKYENRRYKFEVIKGSVRYHPWQVIKVQDKRGGETWYMKTSIYGHNDGILENVGMRAAQVLQFGNGENHIRLGEIVQGTRVGQPERRWIMMRDIKEWNNGVQGQWQEAEKLRRNPDPAFRAEINPRDSGRILALDYIFNNEDRHGGNFMWTRQGNRTRLGIIDNGLLFGGRVNGRRDQIDADMVLKADGIVAAPSMSRYKMDATNNGVEGLRNVGFKIRSPRDRAIFKETLRKATEKFEEELDDILSVERMEANGIKLSESEKSHLVQMRRVAEARINWLKNPTHVDQVADIFI